MDNKLLVEYVEKMKNANCQGDRETNHIMADSVLCELLVKLGYKDVVKEFDNIRKWYA